MNQAGVDADCYQSELGQAGVLTLIGIQKETDPQSKVSADRRTEPFFVGKSAEPVKRGACGSSIKSKELFVVRRKRFPILLEKTV